VVKEQQREKIGGQRAAVREDWWSKSSSERRFVVKDSRNSLNSWSKSSSERRFVVRDSRNSLNSWSKIRVMLTPASTVVQAQEPDALPEPPPITDSRFGIVQAYDSPEVAQAAGVGWTRAILEWNQIQQKAVNDWNPHYFDHVIKWKQQLGQNVPMAGLLIHTPDWASRGRNEDGLPSSVPNGIDEPYNSPQNLWGQFVRKAIQEYKNDINDWVIWNEPDRWNSPNCDGSDDLLA
jgi:hypothetical protein